MFGMNDDDSTNAIELLKRDHDQVEQLFSHYDEIRHDADDGAKKDLVARICDALTVHAEIEEQIFYPAARRALPGEDGKEKDAEVKISIRAPERKREAVGVGAKGGDLPEGSEGSGSSGDLPDEPEVLPDVPDTPPASGGEAAAE